MKKVHTILLVVALLAVSIVPAFAAVSMSPWDNWRSGNALAECGRVANFMYGVKVEGAPYGSASAYGNLITITGSGGYTFGWSSTLPVGAVIVKAGTGANVYTYTPAELSGSGLVAYQGKEVSHVTFCWNPEEDLGQWCSPGYWRQSQHLDSWAATGISPEADYNFHFNPDLAGDPTLWQVLQSPQTYGGAAFNNVGDLLSQAHPGVNFLGNRVENSCPLN
jgi:hypothetical protein